MMDMSARATTEVATQSKKLADSADKLKDSSLRIEDSADRTTQLAGDRTILAAERTYAAWTRTALVALASGVGARTVLGGVIPEWMILANASVLIVFSVFCLSAAVWRHAYSYQPPPRTFAPHLPSWILLCVNGFLACISLATLVALWIGASA
jgi:putative membrane protein